MRKPGQPSEKFSLPGQSYPGSGLSILRLIPASSSQQIPDFPLSVSVEPLWNLQGGLTDVITEDVLQPGTGKLWWKRSLYLPYAFIVGTVTVLIIIKTLVWWFHQWTCSKKSQAHIWPNLQVLEVRDGLRQAQAFQNINQWWKFIINLFAYFIIHSDFHPSFDNLLITHQCKNTPGC